MNAPSGNQGTGASDPFTQFWSDFTSKMSGSGFGMPFQDVAAAREAAAKAARQSFFDAWQQHCEEFMRSEMFLDSMKRAMDSSLSFREQLNAFLTKTWEDSQLPSREDTDSILETLRGFEHRVLDRMDAISSRVEQIETRLDDLPTPSPESSRPKKGTGR